MSFVNLFFYIFSNMGEQNYFPPKTQKYDSQDARRVSPAVTRLTVYRRLQVVAQPGPPLCLANNFKTTIYGLTALSIDFIADLYGLTA
jgi:hypothetical protein